MAQLTAILRPNETVQAGTWIYDTGGAAADYLAVDDAVESPTDPGDAGTDNIRANGATTFICGFETQAAPVVTRVQGFAWARTVNDVVGVNNLELRVTKADNTQLATVAVPEGAAGAWYQADSGAVSLTQADLDGLRFHFIGSGNSGSGRRVFAAYLRITYLRGDLSLTGAG